jgi:hypothetical protein
MMSTPNIGARAAVNLPDHPCFGWPGTIVAVTHSGNSLGPFCRLRLDRPLPAEYRPYPLRHEVNHMLGLYSHEMILL